MEFTPSTRNIVDPIVPTIFLPGRTTGTQSKLHLFHAYSIQRNAAGEVIWEEGDWQSNVLHNEGEQFLLYRAFGTDTSGWALVNDIYLGLDNRTTPAEADTLASLSGEPTFATYNYNRIAIKCNASGTGATGFVVSEVTDWQASTGDKTFTATGGGWSTLKNRFLATSATGTSSSSGNRLLASVPFSTARTVNDGDSIQTSLIIRLSE